MPLYFYWWLVRWHGRLLARLRHWQGIVIGEWSGVISHRLLRHYPSEQHEKLQHENIARQLQMHGATGRIKPKRRVYGIIVRLLTI